MYEVVFVDDRREMGWAYIVEGEDVHRKDLIGFWGWTSYIVM